MSQAALTLVEQLASRLDVEEQLALMEHLAANLRRGATRPLPRNLYGIWRDRFPDDLDIDSVLKEIRSDWQRDAR
jgi:hypothetical protein